MNRPNLFSYATSELSQDAFICWLLAWADPGHSKKDTELHNCAQAFIRALFQKKSKTAFTHAIETIEVKKQYKNIDVLCVVNNSHILLIEDKTWTSDHSNQLARYRETIESESPGKSITPIYFKTEDQSDYSHIEQTEGYSSFLREDFLKALGTYSGNNAILIDYRMNLQAIEDETESYREKGLGDWSYRAWVGFYKKLKKDFFPGDGTGWGYVPNPSGGFVGFWWYPVGKENEYEAYLQLEQSKLCFKISVPDQNKQSKWREAWHQALIERSSEHSIAVKKPPRFGHGATMTVGIHDAYRIQGADMRLDMGKTVELLKRAEALLRTVHEEFQKHTSTA